MKPRDKLRAQTMSSSHGASTLASRGSREITQSSGNVIQSHGASTLASR
eukprot:gene22104-29162_t